MCGLELAAGKSNLDIRRDSQLPERQRGLKLGGGPGSSPTQGLHGAIFSLGAPRAWRGGGAVLVGQRGAGRLGTCWVWQD